MKIDLLHFSSLTPHPQDSQESQVAISSKPINRKETEAHSSYITLNNYYLRYLLSVSAPSLNLPLGRPSNAQIVQSTLFISGSVYKKILVEFDYGTLNNLLIRIE